jgi:hypothetical protein
MSTVLGIQHPIAPDAHVNRNSDDMLMDASKISPTHINRALFLTAAGTVTLALVGLLGALVSGRQFAFSYLTAFVFAASIAIGSLFWIMIHHLTSATWSVVIRRQFENQTLCLLALIPLFIPITLSLSSLYGWMDAGANSGDSLWQAKRPYLNAPWFVARASFDLLCWAGMAWRLRSLSVQQDWSRNPALSQKMVAVSSWGIVVLGLTSTYASFDWMMSLNYRWYSTMYGVYFWAGSFVSSLAAVTLIVVILHANGALRHSINEEHLHDLGKLLFAFVIFWAYISFSQYLLIWYANLTAEIPWYIVRLHGTWLPVTIILMFGHFVIPFVLLLRRDAKRSWRVMGFVAVWLLAFHYLDIAWQVLPALHPTQAQPHWLDFVWLLAFAGVVMLGVLYGLRNSALLPVRDPRLVESLNFHQE